jgi:hypothetical protein
MAHILNNTMSNTFQYKFQKIDSISFRHFLSLVIPSNRIRLQLCPAPSVLILSMRPIANPFYARSTLVPRALAAPVMRRSFVATTSPFPSASFAILPSHIRRFSISDLPSPFSLAISQSTSRTFYSLRNRPCSRLHRLLLRMTGSLPASMHKLRTSSLK